MPESVGLSISSFWSFHKRGEFSYAKIQQGTKQLKPRQIDLNVINAQIEIIKKSALTIH